MGFAVLFQCTLPVPPSVNNLFVNSSNGRGRYPSSKYKMWRRLAAAGMPPTQKAPPLIGSPVQIAIMVSRKSRNDLDNCAKAVIDFLVAQAVILNDNKAIVRRIVLEWFDGSGALVEVSDYAPD